MKRSLLPLCVIVMFTCLNAQQGIHHSLTGSEPQSTWLYLDNQAQSIPLVSFLESGRSLLRLSEDANFEEMRSWEDQYGYEHIRAQQMYTGVPIEGAVLLVHGSAGMTTHANGLVVRGEFSDNEAQISREEALDRVHDLFSEYRFYYEDDAMEQWIRKTEGDPDATFYPEISLVYFDETYSTTAENYTLAWKVDVFIHKEIDHEIVYVDAKSGEILFTEHATTSGCAEHTQGAHVHGTTSSAVIPLNGAGITMYSGIRPIVADSVDTSRYILRDYTRGSGIETYDVNSGDNVGLAEDFVDDDNFWDLRNAQLDEAAIDAHYGAEMTYDYWLTAHDWESYDGNGSKLQSYVHWGVNWLNATWNGRFARFGDGPGTPLTYIDIVAHEFTHGLTGNTAGLIYRNESGALNESFSDIFGTLVEFHALGDSALWKLGIPQNPFRDMSDPNAEGHPDTYGGANWFIGTGDNGGVHTNSGVQNFWFYLLVNGGTGMNDNGDAYTVDSLGFERTAAIAFRNLTTYLTPSSTYLEARFGALQSAADIFGVCSYEVEQVAAAWAAVGVGSRDVVGDLHILTGESDPSSCDLGDQETLGLSFRYNPTGCDHEITAGDSITVGYKVNGGAAVTESLVLSSNLEEGEVLNYTFLTGADLSQAGRHNIDFFISYGSDTYAANDTVKGYELKKPIAIDTNRIISVRNFTLVRDSFLTRTTDNSFVDISLHARRPGTKGVFGFEMTGQDADLDEMTVPFTESQNFLLNREYESSLCFCVDASDWQTLILSFDLRQTYSGLHTDSLRLPIPSYATSMRIMVNGDQVGDQYHPETHYVDPWDRVEVDLDEYAGQYLEVCFQGKHFVNRLQESDENSDTKGDYTYLDNIEFSGKTNVSANDLIAIPLQLFPNPAKREVFVEAALPVSDDMVLKILDMNGRLVQIDHLEINDERISQRINIERLNRGIYTVVISGSYYTAVEKLIVE